MGIFWNRIVSQATILGREIDIDAIVSENDTAYKAVGKVFGVDAMLGTFKEIKVEANKIRYGINGLFDIIAVDKFTQEEMRDALSHGDFMTAYTIALDTIAFALERELRSAEERSKRLRIENCLAVINRIKHNLNEASVVDQIPEVTRKIGLSLG